MITLSKEVVKEELTKVATYNNYKFPNDELTHTELMCEFVMEMFCKRNNQAPVFYDGYMQALKDWCTDDELFNYIIKDEPEKFLKWIEKQMQ